MKRRALIGLTVSILLVAALAYHLPSQPSFNGTVPGCTGNGCHSHQAGIISNVATNNLDVTITLSSTTGNVAGELVNSMGAVVAANNLSSNSTFTLTATQPGVYKINAGYRSPSRVWDSLTVVLGDLPVQLSSFSGVRISENTVRLEWQTLSEINNYGFTVQRRAASENIFAELPGSFVAGHGTTTVPQYYFYTDAAVASGDWYYRLRQQDLDGTVTLSDAIRISATTGVSVEKPRVMCIDQNYPNPFNPSTLIRYEIPQAEHVNLTVFDIGGGRVKSLVDGHQNAGSHTVRWDGTDDAGNIVSSGVFLYTIRAGTSVISKKMMYLR